VTLSDDGAAPIVYDDGSGAALYFNATSGAGIELHVYEDTESTATQVADVNSSGDAVPKDFAVYDDRLYFTARDGTSGREPHAYDGAGVTDIDVYPGTPSGGGSDPIVYDDGSGDKLYVSATDGQSGVELYRFGPNTAPLPVELASFEATPTDDRAVELSWTTASETGNVGFRVQHKRVEPAGDADGWTTIGRRDGAGTTSQPQRYAFTAEGLSVGRHTFRLRQVDADGSVHATDPVTVDLQLRRRARLSAPAPNPVRRRAQIEFAVRTTQPVTLTLYNVLGQKVQVLHDGVVPGNSPTTATLRADQLAGGAYFVRLQTDTSTKTRRLTVVR
jgi:ELWxxDGT repeat protein